MPRRQAPAFIAASAAIAVAVASGCATIPPPLADPSLGSLVSPRPYCGEVRVRVSGEDGAVSFAAVVQAAPPGRAELTAIDPLGRERGRWLVGPAGVTQEGPGGEETPVRSDLLPSPAWYPVAFALLGGRLPAPPIAPPVPVRGGYRATCRIGALALDVLLDGNLAIRRVSGDDGVTVTIGPGRDGFPGSVLAESANGRLEVVPLSLEECADPFGGGVR